LARRPRAFAEEAAQELPRPRALPPVLADLTREPRAQLRRPDPRAEIVGRVEPRVHVRQVAALVVAHSGRRRQLLGVAAESAAVLVEARPEAELVAELRGIAAEEERLQERVRLRVLGRFLVGELEVLHVPTALACDQ